MRQDQTEQSRVGVLTEVENSWGFRTVLKGVGGAEVDKVKQPEGGSSINPLSFTFT